MSANHRFVVRHVRYWRGAIQKWSTVYQYQGTPFGGTILTADLTAVKNNDQDMCYSQAAHDGGVYQVECYDQTAGGPPVASINYFDPEAPGAWPGFPGTVWPSFTQPMDPVAETALSVRWPAGVSSTGKAVYMRKWYHAVPTSTAAAGAVDVSSAAVTALTTQATALQNCLTSRGMALAPLGRTSVGLPVVNPYYENHQMPRGRRRKALVTASGRYTGPSIVVPSLD